MNKKFGIISSSQNPEEIANKVKGLVLLFSSLVILIAGKFFHLSLTANDITSLATDLGVITGAVWTVYGTVLHLLAIIFKKEPTI